MTTGYRIDLERRVIFSSGSGVLTDEDLFDHQARLTGDPEFDRSFDQLYDLREVTKQDVAEGTLRMLAEARSFEPGVKRAVVAPRDVLYRMAQMFQTLHDDAPEEFRVFRTIKEATAWLELD